MVAKPLLAIPMVAKLIAIPMVAAKPEKRLGVYKTPSIEQERERVRSVQDRMPRSDIEVFDYLTSSSETTAEIDYLTYALFAYRKRQWMRLIPLSQVGQYLGLAGQIRNGAGFEFFGS
jgi:hypothetical protein